MDIWTPPMQTSSGEVKPDFQKELDAVHAALCANRMTNDVANFLTDLYARIRKLEETCP